MRILVYGCPDAGPKTRCLALIVDETGKKDSILPVYHFGATAAEARTKAQTWWDGEVAKLRAKAELSVRRSQARRKVVADAVSEA